MNNGPSSAFQVFIACIYPSWSILWTILWLKVARHYGKAAFTTWKTNGSTLRVMYKDVVDPMVYAFHDSLYRWRWSRKLFGVKEHVYSQNLIPTTSPGNILRFAIFVASFTPISYGVAFAFTDMWRAPLWQLLVVVLFMVTSILGALGHLFLAHRGNPPKWSRIITYSTIWFLLAPVATYFLRQWFGW
jgi:hypothetical protein